jgi:hypothetical protein
LLTSFLAARGMSGRDVVLFALVTALVPPLLLLNRGGRRLARE